MIKSDSDNDCDEERADARGTQDAKAFVQEELMEGAARGLMVGGDRQFQLGTDSDAQGAVSSLLQIASLAAGRNSIALNIGVPWGMIEKYLGWLRVDFFFEIMLPNAPGETVKALQIVAYVYFTCFLWFRLNLLRGNAIGWPKPTDWVRNCWVVAICGVLPAILLCSIGANLAYFDSSNHGSTRSIFSDDATATNSSDLEDAYDDEYQPDLDDAYDDEYQPRSGFFTGWLIRADPSSPCELSETNTFLAFGIIFTVLTCLACAASGFSKNCEQTHPKSCGAEGRMVSHLCCLFAMAIFFVCLILFSAWEECQNGEMITTSHYP